MKSGTSEVTIPPGRIAVWKDWWHWAIKDWEPLPFLVCGECEEIVFSDEVDYICTNCRSTVS